MSTLINPNGSVKAVVSSTVIENMLNHGVSCNYVDSEPGDLSDYWNGKEWVAIGYPPEPFMLFDYDIKDWLDPRTLDQAKELKWTKIKQERSNLEFGGFEYNGHTYDSDQVSQGRILNAALAGVEQVWTTADNDQVLLNPDQLTGLYIALQTHIRNVHERGRIAREKIDQATTLEQIDDIKL